MAIHSQTSSSSYIVIGLLVLLIAGIISAKAQPTSPLVNDLCKTTSDPAFCLKALGSDPRSAKANLDQLIPVALDLAVSEGINTRLMITALLSDTKIDPRIKAGLENCDKYYEPAVDHIKLSRSEFPKHQYNTIKAHVAAAGLAPSMCEDGFKKSPSVSSPLTENDHNFSLFIEMLTKLLSHFG